MTFFTAGAPWGRVGWGQQEHRELGVGGRMASLTPAVPSTARQCQHSAGRDWDEGTHGCPLLGCMVWMAHVDVSSPPAHVQGGSAWTGGKPGAGKTSHSPTLGVCPNPINIALAPGFILVVWAVGGHRPSLASSVIFLSRLMGVCGHGREWDPSPHCPQQAVG